MSLEKWIPEGLEIAETIAGHAKCTRRTVGAVIIDEHGTTVSTGRNGAPPGATECIDGGCPRGRADYDVIRAHSDYNSPGPGFCVSSHAEDNAIIRAGMDRCRGALLVVNHAPCASCVKRAAGAGIALVAWRAGLRRQESSTPQALLDDLVRDSA